jgi:hypothetical protein
MNAEDLPDRYLARIAADWISYFSSSEGSRDDDPALYNPFGVVCELVRCSPLNAWYLINFILNEDKEERTLDLLAAGPLEDFISLHGSQWIDEIEETAEGNLRFCSLLAGTRQFRTPDDVWRRVVIARGNAKPFECD